MAPPRHRLAAAARDGKGCQAAGADEIVVRTTADNPGVLPLVLGSGLRGRIRMGAADLTVRIPVRQRSRV
jgi:hypothetical protein